MKINSVLNQVNDDRKQDFYLMTMGDLNTSLNVWEMVSCSENGLTFALFVQLSVCFASFCKWCSEDKSF